MFVLIGILFSPIVERAAAAAAKARRQRGREVAAAATATFLNFNISIDDAAARTALPYRAVCAVDTDVGAVGDTSAAPCGDRRAPSGSIALCRDRAPG